MSETEHKQYVGFRIKEPSECPSRFEPGQEFAILESTMIIRQVAMPKMTLQTQTRKGLLNPEIENLVIDSGGELWAIKAVAGRRVWLICVEGVESIDELGIEDIRASG